MREKSMYKKVALILAFIVTVFFVGGANAFAAAVWQYVGSAGFSTAGSPYTSLAIDDGGTPYIAYRDDGHSKKATVMKFNGSDWEAVGEAGFTGGEVAELLMALDGSGTPYVAYRDVANSNKATVMKYNGSGWETVGGAGFSAGEVSYTSLAIDGSGIPYFAYRDGGNSNKATVMKYNGSAWEAVGGAGFSAGQVYYTSLAADGSGNLYIAYEDGGLAGKATVMKYDGSSWGIVGSAGFSAGLIAYASIKIDDGGTPYVAYKDAANANKTTVMKYNGTGWEAVGSVGFSAGAAEFVTLAMDGSGTPYVAYRDGGISNKATVMKFDGSGWAEFGSAGFSAGAADFVSLAIDGDGILYVSYLDKANSNKATVMMFAPDTSAPVVADGTISAVSLSDNQVTLLWNKATDNASAQSDLQYLVYISDSDNIDTVTNIEANGTAVGSFASGDTKAITGLTMDTTYYFNVIVKDEAGNKNAYDMKEVTTAFVSSGWQSAGGAGFSAGQADFVSLAVDDGGTPYVAYKDAANSGKATVMKYIGSDWVPVGTAGFSAGAVNYLKLAIDGSGIPYVAFSDGASSNMAAVMKYNGTNWETVGSTGFSAGAIDYLSLALDGGGTPYVAYRDLANSNKATVMKYNGSGWETVGSAGFSSGTLDDTSLAIDGSGTPYVAYRDYGNSSKTTVMKYNGSGWEAVGGAGFSAGAICFPSLAMDGGTVYCAYLDAASSGKATVMKYNGSGWETVGGAGFSSGSILNVSIALGGDGTPYVAYEDGGHANKATVMKLNGNSWEAVGSEGFSDGIVDYIALAIDDSGTPYVAYKDMAVLNRATVMKYAEYAVPATYTIAPIGDQTMTALTAGYVSGTQETKTITVTRTGTGDLANLAVALSGANASSFNITQPAAATLDASTTSTTFTVNAKDDLAAGTYIATVTVGATSMSDESFTVTQVVDTVPVLYTVTFDKNGGDTDANPVTKTAAPGGNVGTLPGEPTRAGYTFIGWIMHDGHDTVFTAATPVTGNITVYAKWKLNPLSMTMSPDNAEAADAISVSGKTTAGTDVSIKVVKADGTSVYALDTTAGGDGSFSGSYNVPAGMTSGILYGSASAVGRKVTANVVVHEASYNVTPKVEIDSGSVAFDDTNRYFEFKPDAPDEIPGIEVYIPASVTDATIGVTQLLNAPDNGVVTTRPLPAMYIGAETSISADPVRVDIPGNVAISASASDNWDGTINMPTIKANNSVSVSADPGKKAAVNAVVEIGYGDVPLTFSRAVRIEIPGMSGKDAGYSREGVFTKITRTLSADDQATADSEIPAGGDARFDDGSNLIIWTRHFTNFVVYTQTAVPPPPAGGGGTGGSPSNASYYAVVTGTGITTYTLPVSMNASGGATVDIGAREDDFIAGGGKLTVTMPSIPGITFYTLGIPPGYMSESDVKGEMTLVTVNGNVMLRGGMLEGITEAKGNKTEIIIGQGDKTSLSEKEKAAVGDRPLVKLKVMTGGTPTEWNPKKPAAISIPYTPKSNEQANPECIITWSFDDSGNAVCIPWGHYDSVVGTVNLSTSHSGSYAVGYKKTSFLDVAAKSWYYKAVGFIAARGITAGTGNGNFSPEAGITRGEFIVMLMRSFGISPDIKPKENFTDAGNAYYTGYLAAAKRLGISNGVGNNMFAPDKEITRQEMFTQMYHALKAVDRLPEVNTGKRLSDFSDAGQVAVWAKDVMALFVENGIISGDGNKLFPTATTTRAQMAEVLCNLLSR